MSAEITGNLDSLIESFTIAPDATVRELRTSMKICVRKVQSDARKDHNFISRSGGRGLEGAIRTRIENSGLSGFIFLDKRIPYADAIHNGSRPHKIVAKNKKALYFVKGGTGIFAKGINHPGTKPDKFLNKSLEKNEGFIKQSVIDVTERSLHAARLK